MFDRDTWTGVNGKTHAGPRLRTWKSLTDAAAGDRERVRRRDAPRVPRIRCQDRQGGARLLREVSERLRELEGRPSS